MSRLAKLAAFAVASFCALGLAASAQAALITTAFTAPPGPYNLGNPTGTLAANHVTQPNTYDYTFTITGKFDVLMQMQASMFRPVQPQLLAFTLFKGLPGSGVAVANSGAPMFGPAIDLVLGPGSYYLELLPGDIAQNNELVSGALTITAAPEPATWGLMITGVGLLGLAARRRRQLAL